MAILIGALFLTVVIICVLFKSLGVYAEEFEIHILGLIKVKFKNKEKRSEGPARPTKRTLRKK